MTDHKLYDIFLEMFPQYKDHVVNYGHSVDGHIVRVTTDAKDILFFTYNNADDWRLETGKAYVGWEKLKDQLTELKRKKKENKKND